MAFTPTSVGRTEFSGKSFFQSFTVPITSASDTIDLSSYFTSIIDCIAIPYAGVDNDFQTAIATVSGTTVTVTAYEADGTAADDFASTAVKLWVIGTYN